MNIQQIIYVVEIDKYKSFSSAASALYISQPRLSQAVKELENELGFDIFERSRKGIVGPTLYGYEFISQAKKVLRSFNNLESFKEKSENVFKITTTLLPVAQDSFRELLDRHINDNNLNFEMRFCGCYESADKVKEDSYNIGVITIIEDQLSEWISYFSSKNLSFEDIISSSFYITLNRDSPLSDCNKIRAEDLSDYLYVTEKCSRMNHLTLEVYSIFDSLFSSSKVSVSNTDVMYTIVKDNRAFTLDSLKVDKRTAKRYNLISIPFDNELKCHVGIIRKNDAKLTQLSAEYISILKKNIKRYIRL